MYIFKRAENDRKELLQSIRRNQRSLLSEWSVSTLQKQSMIRRNVVQNEGQEKFKWKGGNTLYETIWKRLINNNIKFHITIKKTTTVTKAYRKTNRP